MAVKWTENKEATGVTWYKSDCEKYTCFKGAYAGMLEDGSASPSYVQWSLMMKGRGYMGQWGTLGFFNTAKETTAFVNECEAAQQWPEQHVDRREHLDELRRYVQHHGNIAIAKRKAEEAERRTRQEAEDAEARAKAEAAAAEQQLQEELAYQRKLTEELAAAEKAVAEAEAKRLAKEAEKAAKAEAVRATKESKVAAKKPRKTKVVEEDAPQESLFA